MTEIKFYQTQSVFSDPGSGATTWDHFPVDIEAMRKAVTPLVFHYRGDGDFAANGITQDRIEEINLRYAADMLTRLIALSPIEPGSPREARHRIVGCCRDWALLLVSLARHHGITARSRVGFANYFVKDWWLDHVVAEIWDEGEHRWRLVDAQLHEDHVNASTGDKVDPADIGRDEFLPGLDAWKSVRGGELDAEQFVVDPEIPAPNLRGMPYLWHNVVQDLAALNKREMVLWDVWGIDCAEVNEDGAALLDRVAAAENLDEWQSFYDSDHFRTPETVQSYIPFGPFPPRQVKLRTQ